ncbi:MAG: O-antigen ligase family protein [Candidatus Saganbacteria bacterium]|nr:O-antigen ligase family protein [Candidatus Saganbacteria bacterium]
MTEKISKYIDYAIEITILLIILFAPLYFDRRIGIVFSLSKATWIRALTLIVVGLWVTKLSVGGGKKLIRTGLDLPVVTYLLCVAAATLLSINVYISIVGSYGRYEGFITIINYAALFFISTNFLADEVKMRRVLMLSVMAAVVMSSYGLIQRLEIDPYAWGGVLTAERVIATIGQPNFLAAYLDMTFMLGLLLLFTLKKNYPLYKIELKPKYKKAAPTFRRDWNEIFFQAKFALAYISAPLIFIYAIYHAEGNTMLVQWLLAFLLIFGISIYFSWYFEELDTRLMNIILTVSLCFIFLGILSTQSRGGWFGLICALALFILLCGRKIFFDNIRIWGLIAGICVLVTLFSFMNLGSQQAQRFFEVNVAERSGAARLDLKGAAGSRLETWTSALRFIPDRPVFGVGPEVIKMVFPQYETPMFRFKEAFHVKQDRCHNEVLDMTVTRGFVTLCAYIFLLAQVFFLCISGIKKRPKDQIMLSGLLGAMTAYLVQNQFSFGVVAITSLFWIMIGMAAHITSKKEETQERKKDFRPDWVPVILAWALIAVLLYISAFPYIADKFYKTAKNESDSNQAEASQSDYKKALDFSAYEGMYYTNFGMAALNVRSGNREEDIKQVKRTVSIFEQGQKADPYNADNYYMAARTYLILTDLKAGDFNQSSEAYTIAAIKIDPYYAEAYQNMGFLSERKGRTKEAISFYEKAFAANPTLADVGKAIYRYYKFTNEPEKAAEVFDKVLAQNPDGIDVAVMIGSIYTDLGMFDKANDYYTRVLEKNSGDVRAMTGIGIICVNTGKTDKAFEIFQTVMLSDPAYPQLHSGLGLYYYKKGDIKTARQEVDQALSLDGQNETALKLKNILK